jgi:hypothetical protein
MKKTDRNLNGEMRPEYDFASMKGGVRGKYVKRLRGRTNIVVLEPEVAEAFPNERAVNQPMPDFDYLPPCDTAEREELQVTIPSLPKP